MIRQAGLSPWRLRLVAVVFAVCAGALAARLVQIQILDHGRYDAEARDIHFWRQEIDGPRGAILDRNGFPLVTGIDTFNIHVDREAWEQHPENERLAVERLSRLLGVTEEQVRAIVAGGSGRDTLVALSVPYELGESIITAGLPGVKVAAAGLRRYLEGGLASQILGFVGRDNVGLSGVEYDLDNVLQGKPGEVVYERDSVGNPIPFGIQTLTPMQPGADVVLTIDRTLQRIAEKHLQAAIEKSGARGGTIILLEPHSGDILALASTPTYDVSALDLSDPTLDLSLFRNRAVTDLYEPGSVMKVITMAAALDAGSVTPTTTYVDTGAIVVGARTIRNFDLSFHGRQTMTQVLQRSLNTGATWVSNLLGPDLFYWYVRQFGFGAPTGSGFAGEAAGIVKEPGNIFWSPVDLATNSYGQGISATPLQIVQAYGVIANGGELVRPRIVRGVIARDGVHIVPPVIERRVIREETAAQLRGMMQAVVDGVLGHPAQTPGWPVAGKSGTSDVAEEGVYLEGESIASFVGFAPADDPRVVVLVKLDRPQGEIFGGIVAAPVFAGVLRDILPYLGVPPSDYVAEPSIFDPPPGVLREPAGPAAAGAVAESPAEGGGAPEESPPAGAGDRPVAVRPEQSEEQPANTEEGQ